MTGTQSKSRNLFTDPLHIDHVLTGIAAKAAGPSYTVPALAREQGRAGHDVAIHSLGSPVELSNSNWNDRRYSRDKTVIPVLEKLGMSRSLQTALIAIDSDVLHAHGLWQMPCIYAARAARIGGKPLVISPRGMLSPAALHYSRGRKQVFALTLQNGALAHASMFHATAMSEHDDIRSFGFKQPIAIIPNGVDVPQLNTRIRETQTRTVLSLGRIHPKKGLDLLIKAWAQIEKVHPYWQLKLVGPDEVAHSAELQNLIDKLGLRRVSISGPVFGSEKWDAYANADLFILPTRSENFAVTVAEALASSVPVISSKGAPWAGLETNRCGWWIDLGVPEITDALKRAMDMDDETRNMMGARGRAWMIRDFSWDKIAQDLVIAYRWLLTGGNTPRQIRLE